jgi:putative ABC transport system ATP-binding protein
MMPRLEFRDVSHRRGGRVVLHDVSFRVAPGECFTILGPSGSGKTSLLRLCNRLDDPATGEILLDGKLLTVLDPVQVRRRVGMVFQTPVMLDGTVADNIAYGATLAGRGISPTVLLKQVGLNPDLASRNAAELSLGQQQRVELARVLANEPEILLLDEPTSGLDIASSRRILELISALRQDLGITIIFVTHLLEQAERLADRVGLLVDGRLGRITGKSAFFSGSRAELERLFAE